MRASFLIFLGFLFLASYLWVTFEGSFLVTIFISSAILFVFTVSYADSMLLFLLGARELRSSDEKHFFQAASQEAYKLAVSMPRLYFYNGYLERAFVFHNHDKISIVLNKELLETSSIVELKAICFELLLQVKKGMAAKRTKSMFILGFLSWATHSIVRMIMKLVPIKEVRKSADWFVGYLLHPVLDLIFSLVMGKNYFKKLSQHIDNYPHEKELLEHFHLKLRNPILNHSLAYKKVFEMHSLSKNYQFQNIMTLEFLPHEWDYLFKHSGLTIAQ
jgi:hypothetical protein